MAKILLGQVVSISGDKTVVVAVSSRRRHRIYGKQYSVTKRITVHDAKTSAKLGDTVKISEIKPVSRHKSWQIDQVVLQREEAKS